MILLIHSLIKLIAFCVQSSEALLLLAAGASVGHVRGHKVFQKRCEESKVEMNRNIQPPPATYSNVKHSKIHPKFLNSNSTSHRWPFGAMAELLDNAMDPDVKAQQ